MSDFDFEELDKAVTNVLGDSPAPREASQQTTDDSPRPEPSVPARSADPTPALSSPATPAPGALPVSPVASTPAIAPRSSINRQSPGSGRKGVIDIMAPPSKRPSREAAVVAAPRTDSSAADPVKPEPVAVPKRVPTEDAALRWPPKPEADAAGALDSPVTPPSDAPAPAEPAKKDTPASDDSFERFDSLSSSGFDFNDKKDDTSATQPSIDTPIEDSASEPEKESQSPQSPFLSDAKVEKRPLGSFSNYTPAADDKPTEDTSGASESNPISAQDSAAAPAPNEPASDVPAQQDTIMAPSEPAESSAAMPATTVDTPLPGAEQPLKEPDVKLDHLLTDGHEHHQPAQPLTDKSPTAMSSMDSIPQQYKIEPSPANDAPHQAFDTKEYHAPLKAHPDGKTHHGNGLLIASIVLLVLAVAAAVGIYFYGDKLGL